MSDLGELSWPGPSAFLFLLLCLNEQRVHLFHTGIKILFLQNTDINNDCRGAIPVLKCFAGLRPKLSK